MPGDVEHGAAPRVSRHVDGVRRGHDEPPHVRRRMLDRRRQELAHRLHAVKKTCRLRGDDAHLRLRRGELIAFVAELRRSRRVDVQRDARIGNRCAGREALSRSAVARRDDFRRERADGLDLSARVVIDEDDGARRDEKAVGARNLNRGRIRNDRVRHGTGGRRRSGRRATRGKRDRGHERADRLKSH